MKPGDPDVFVASIAAVLAEYPLGLVRECVDPRTGVARKAKFLSVAELVEWLDSRLEFHRAVAVRKPLPTLPAPFFSAEHCAMMAAKIKQLVAGIGRGEDPIMRMKRLARENAEQQLAADKARALAGTAE